MLCPHDKINLQTVSVKGTNIDICTTCNGIFLDKDEILKLIDIDRNELKLIDTTEETNRKTEEKLWQDEIACPKCHQLMQKFAYAGSTDIIIDTCRNGCGLWLDKGEIFKIADYLSKAQQPLDSKQQNNIKQILSTLDKKKELNIWQLFGKRYSNNQDLLSDLDSTSGGKYISMIMAVLQGIVFFLLRKK